MKSFKILTAFLLIALVFSLFAALPAAALDNPTLTASSFILVDAKTGVELGGSGEHDKVYPASTTKIMTVMLAVEAVEDGKFSLTDPVTASDTVNDKLDATSSNANPAIQPGETMTLQDLMYCALVASANEACNVIAEYIGGSISNFVNMMNTRAKELGCTGTHFSNPHGMPADDHYTTAADMSLIALQAVSYNTFADIFGASYIEIDATNMSDVRQLTTTNDLINKNKPDNYYQYCTGGKTGSASSAGYCLVSTAQKGDISLLAVVMDSGTDANNTPQHFADTKTLYDWGFGNFSYREVLSSTENVDRTVPVTMGSGADSVALRPENSISILLANDDDLSTFQRDFSNIPASLEAPVEVGTYLGDISISRNGTVYGTSRLLAATSVSQDRIANLKQQIDKTWKLPQVQTVFWILVALFALYLIYLVIYYIRRFRYRRSVRQARRLRKQQLAQQPRGLPENYGGGDGGYSVTGARRATGQFEPQASQRIPQMAQGEAWRGSTSTGIQQSQRTPILQDTRNRRAEGSEIQPPESKDSEERQGFFEDFFNNQ